MDVECKATCGRTNGGSPILRRESSSLTETASSYIVAPNSSSKQSYNTDKHQISHGSLQSSLCKNDSPQGQSPIHECLQDSAGFSVQCSSSRSCLSGGSPELSQISQSFPSDSQNFQSAESGYSDNEKPSHLKNVLHELETALLGPDLNASDNSENPNDETGDAENSEWSLEALNSVTGTVYGEPERAHLSRDENNECVLENIGGQSVNVERVTDVEFSNNVHFPKSSSEEKKEAMELEIPRVDVRQLLVACAKAIADGNIIMAAKFIASLRQVVSVCGDPIERLGAYMVEGLVARLGSSGANIYKTLRCKEPASSELLSHMQVLYEVSPYFKFGYLAANGAIVEALKHEDRVHIIDFQIAQGTQWVTLIQALAGRPGGPPHVRITGIDDPVSEYARDGGLQLIGHRLSKLAESRKVPFEFHAVPVFGHQVERDMLEIRSGEALAVNFAFQLHHMPDESVSTSNHRDRLLRMVKGMSPKVVALVEQESNTNTAPFVPRFIETLDYYTAMFESLDLTLPRDSKNRINVEQHCLARDIVNVIACEGAERVERHEVFGKWKARFTMAGFRPCPLSSYVNSAIKSLMRIYADNYRLAEKDEALYLGWLDRDLVVASAWH